MLSWYSATNTNTLIYTYLQAYEHTQACSYVPAMAYTQRHITCKENFKFPHKFYTLAANEIFSKRKKLNKRAENRLNCQ